MGTRVVLLVTKVGALVFTSSEVYWLMAVRAVELRSPICATIKIGGTDHP